MKKIAGLALIVAPFVVWVILVSYVIGTWNVLGILGAIVLLFGVVGFGFWLLDA